VKSLKRIGYFCDKMVKYNGTSRRDGRCKRSPYERHVRSQARRPVSTLSGCDSSRINEESILENLTLKENLVVESLLKAGFNALHLGALITEAGPDNLSAVIHEMERQYLS
jgi:hypothetical protein